MSNYPKGAAIVFGATGGIGQSVCLELAKAGSDIAVIYNSSREKAESLKNSIQKLGRHSSSHACDVTARRRD